MNSQLQTERENPRVSIVVNNYNYERYLSRAIESALGQTYENVEVIVVDDGSTDDSRRVIESFGTRVKAIFKNNGGQASALNAGFAAASGELVYFLDADDIAAPDCLEKVVERYRSAAPETAIFQFRLQMIAADGAALPRRMPEIERMQGGAAARLLGEKGSYVFPPTSGNVFDGKILRRIMPIPEADFRIAADIYLCTMAALHGSIEVFETTLGCYRLHGANNFASADHLENVPVERFVELMLNEAATRRVSKRLCAAHLRRPIGGNTDLLHLIFDAANRRLQPPRASRVRLAGEMIEKLRADQSPLPLRNKIGAFVYLTTIALLPAPLVRSLIEFVFVRPPKSFGALLKKSFGR